MKKRWKYAGFKRLVGSGKDAITSMSIQTLNIGRKIQERLEETGKRTSRTQMIKMSSHIFSD